MMPFGTLNTALLWMRGTYSSYTDYDMDIVGLTAFGPLTAQVAGDYAIGSNHVLPTAGAARVRGGLSAADFVRQITVQRLTRAGLRRVGQTVIDLAMAEGLTSHAASVVIRMKGPRP